LAARRSNKRIAGKLRYDDSGARWAEPLGCGRTFFKSPAISYMWNSGIDIAHARDEPCESEIFDVEITKFDARVHARARRTRGREVPSRLRRSALDESRKKKRRDDL
jgi:hypothetical protein